MVWYRSPGPGEGKRPVLDVNVDYVSRDGERDMHELVSRLVTNVNLPLMLDSTEWQKMEAGLVAEAKILNSTNYEDGDERFGLVLERSSLWRRWRWSARSTKTAWPDGREEFAIARRATATLSSASRRIFCDLALPISTGIEEDRLNGCAMVDAIRMIRGT